MSKWRYTKMLLAAVAIILAIVGYYVYGRNIMHVETGEFSIWPWLIFFLLGANDFANYLASNSNWFEIAAGLIVMLGPLVLTILIILRGKKERLSKASWNDLEFGEIILFIGVTLSIVLITIVEVYTQDNTNIWVEYGFLTFAIVLDFIALAGLFADIKKSPKDFELSSWLLFLLAGVLATYVDISLIGVQVNPVALILIFENVFVSLAVIPWIIINKRYWTGTKNYQAPHCGAWKISVLFFFWKHFWFLFFREAYIYFTFFLFSKFSFCYIYSVKNAFNSCI